MNSRERQGNSSSQSSIRSMTEGATSVVGVDPSKILGMVLMLAEQDITRSRVIESEGNWNNKDCRRPGLIQMSAGVHEWLQECVDAGYDIKAVAVEDYSPMPTRRAPEYADAKKGKKGVKRRVDIPINSIQVECAVGLAMYLRAKGWPVLMVDPMAAKRAVGVGAIGGAERRLLGLTPEQARRESKKRVQKMVGLLTNFTDVSGDLKASYRETIADATATCLAAMSVVKMWKIRAVVEKDYTPNFVADGNQRG